jgi:hypothetical protein
LSALQTKKAGVDSAFGNAAVHSTAARAQQPTMTVIG